MADLEQSLEELEGVKQAFKSNLGTNGISTSSIEFRNYPNLINQMEKKLPTQTKTITPTKEKQTVSADTGYKLDSVEVYEIPDEYIIPTGTKEITENGTHSVSEYANVEVNVQSTEPNLIEKEITANGTYTASDDGADGYSSVVVEIQGGAREDMVLKKLTVNNNYKLRQAISNYGIYNIHCVDIYNQNTSLILDSNYSVQIKDSAITMNPAVKITCFNSGGHHLFRPVGITNNYANFVCDIGNSTTLQLRFNIYPNHDNMSFGAIHTTASADGLTIARASKSDFTIGTHKADVYYWEQETQA